MTPLQRLSEAGILLPEPMAPVAAYVPCLEANGLLFVSGQVPFGPDGRLIVGKLGDSLDVTAGGNAARAAALMVIAQINAALSGRLDRVSRIVKLGVFVNCTPDFTEQPKVANGASELFELVFGPSGKHARTAVGAPSLPLGIAVEVDAIAAIDPD